MALNGFRVLLFVPALPEVLPQIKKNYLRCVLPPNSPITAFTQCA